MVKALGPFLGATLVLCVAACGGSSTAVSIDGGNAKVTIEGKTFDVKNVELSYEFGDDGYFRIEGEAAANPDQECVEGLSGGLALYGEMPVALTSLADLAGEELAFEFSGDGDDANLCFAGMNGLLGVETGTVRFSAVDGTEVRFSFSGSFVVYDGKGGQSSSEVTASGARALLQESR
ncbi:MAG: hypothetical protein ACRD2N_23000 [Vicinamibacterales bacterium]